MTTRRERQRERQRQYDERNKHPCPVCGKMILRKSTFCGKHRQGCKKGPQHHSWKGGRGRYSQGYIWVHKPDHPRATKQGRVREHILIWEQAHGPTPPGWEVHHINGIKDDNRLVNLLALPPRAHFRASSLRLLLKQAQRRVRQLEAELALEQVKLI